jgi:hypothetical protein
VNDVKIRFSPESHGPSAGRHFRQIEDVSFPTLFQGLLLASDPDEYRIYAKKIRALARIQAVPDFLCLHPEWFAEQSSSENDEEKIDATVCTFCGYFQQCEKANTEFSVDVMFLMSDDGASPIVDFAEGLLKKAFEFHHPSSSAAYNDPFSGFSRRAGEPRTLYAVSYSDMDRTLFDRFGGGDFASCVGYDLLTSQPLWPLDFILLSTMGDTESWDSLLLNSKKMAEEGGRLNVSDERFLAHYLDFRAIECPSDKMELLTSELYQIIEMLSSDAAFEALNHRPFTPLVDHPFSMGSTLGLHLLFRLFELTPGLLETSLFNHAFPQFFSMMQKVHDTSSPNQNATKHDTPQRLLPRFPAVLFLPKAGSSIMFDLPACKIIDVVDAEINQPMLLFDALDFDLGAVRGWNIA